MLLVNNKDNYPVFSNEIPSQYRNIEYYNEYGPYCSCIVFGNNNEFYENDCDSNPTNMPYSGEDYTSYEYNPKDNSIVFKGKNMNPISAEILYLEGDKLTIKVHGSNQDIRCAVNNKDIYEYYLREVDMIGSEVKEYLKKIDNGSLIIKLSIDYNLLYCNMESAEVCLGAKIISTEDIYSQINDTIVYKVYYYRDQLGNVKAVGLSKKV